MQFGRTSYELNRFARCFLPELSGHAKSAPIELVYVVHIRDPKFKFLAIGISNKIKSLKCTVRMYTLLVMFNCK